MKRRSATWLLRAVTMGMVGCLCVCALATEPDKTDRSPKSDRSMDEDARQNHRIREGSKLEAVLGEFREAEGKRIRFYLSDEKTSFVVIENLALDRVSRVLDENTSARTWSVSGVVTEYRDRNYLLVTRAALKARKRVTATTAQN